MICMPISVALVEFEGNPFPTECDGIVMFRLRITNGITKGPGRTCSVSVWTYDGSAQGKRRYFVIPL